MIKIDKRISRIKKEIKPEDLPDLTFEFHKSKNTNVSKKSSNTFKPRYVRSEFIII